MNRWTERTELPARRLLGWLGLGTSKFHDWKHRYGKVNEHNGKVPRDWWLHDWEKQASLDYHERHPLEGYRRLTFMMLDDDVVATSPASVYRVLKAAGRLDRRSFSPSKKGTGFVQPLAAHEHWHGDVSYINVGGTFDYLTSVLDGFSRAIVHWEIRESMTERDVETIVQRGLERYPDKKPRIISDNGAVHRAGLQGIHPRGGDHARADQSVRPPIQRQAGTLARPLEAGMRSSRGARFAGGGPASDFVVC